MYDFFVFYYCSVFQISSLGIVFPNTLCIVGVGCWCGLMVCVVGVEMCVVGVEM